MASLHSLPSDIILEIASYFSLSSEALQLGLTSSRIFEHIIPLLYSKVTLKGSAQCLQTLKMLGSHPQRARHVRSLRLQPNGSTVVVTPQSSRPRSNLAEVYEICAALRRAAFGMEVLQRFVWDADELPEDEIWFALRRFCPQLKYIGTSFGSILPSGNSHLFDFTNLRGFSAVFKEGFFLSFEGLISFDGIPREEAFPGYDRLWDMLIKRCPGLEELIIDGLSPTEPVDAHRLTRGRWPKLRKLVLGDIVVDWHTAINSHTKRSFITFLDAHPSITSLHLHSHQPSISAPPILESLQPHSLSKLREFTGSLDQLQALQHKADLHSLRVPDSILLRESTPLAISGMLSSVPNLTSLSISFTLLHGYDNGSIIRSIASACPLLDHLDFTCMGRASFKLETFCRAIKPLGRLKSLHLQIVKARGEENIAACGSQLVLTNPRLSTFKISFLALDSTFNERSNLPAVLQSASFHLTSDHHGLPVSLHITEHHQSLLKWRVAPRRIHDVDLRPVGFPGSQSESIWSLIMSPSPAGQEMRMLGLCIGLLTSAVIGSIVL